MKKFIEIIENNFNINYKEKIFPLSMVAKNVFSQISDSEKPYIVIYPGGDELNIFSIIYYALFERYINYSGFESNITDELIIGDKVYYEGNLGTFQGKKTYADWGINSRYIDENTMMTKISYADEACRFIPESDLYKLTKYNGDAKRLNKIRKSGKKYDNKQLIKAFELDEKSVNSLIHNSVLYIKKKNEFDNILNSLQIAYKNSKPENLNEVVPMQYCSSSENCMNYNGNIMKLNSALKVVNDIGNGLDMLFEHDDIDRVVIDFDNYRHIDFNVLEHIFTYTDIKCKVVLLPLKHYRDFKSYFNEDSYQIIKLSNKDMINRPNKLKYSDVINNQSIIFEYYLKKTIEFKSIDEENSDLFMNIYKMTKQVQITGDEQIQGLANKVFRLLSTLKSYIFFDNKFGKESKAYINDFLSQIKNEVSILNDMQSYHQIEKLIEISDLINHLTKNILKSNSMASLVVKTLKYSPSHNILFIVQSNRIKKIIDEYINDKYLLKNIDCRVISKIKDTPFYDEIYILGVIPNTKLLFNTLFSLNNSMHFHYVYQHSYLKYVRNEYNRYKNDCDNLLEKYSDVHDLQENYNDNEAIDWISQLVEYNLILSDENHVKYLFESNHELTYKQCDYVIDLDEYMGVFNEKYKIYRVNFDSKELDYVPISSLQEGDEILILNEEFKSGEFIEELINELLNEPLFKERHYKQIMMSKVWKNLLSEKIESSKMSYKKAYKELQKIGLDKNYATFRSWLKNEYIVGPQNEEDYRIIFEYCNEIVCKYSWREIYEACSYVRKLHVRLRTDMGQLIVNSYNVDGKADQELDYLNIDFMAKVSVCEVVKMINNKIKVPAHVLNTVRRKE